MKNTFKNRSLITLVLELAERHISKGDKAYIAEVCYQEACKIMSPAWHDDQADITGVDRHALCSLSYSVGRFHTDYKQALSILDEAEIDMDNYLPKESFYSGNGKLIASESLQNIAEHLNSSKCLNYTRKAFVEILNGLGMPESDRRYYKFLMRME
jgi:hypothetical protein